MDIEKASQSIVRYYRSRKFQVIKLYPLEKFCNRCKLDIFANDNVRNSSSHALYMILESVRIVQIEIEI